MAIFVALGLGITGLPLPDETLMAYAGFLVFQGTLNYLYVIIFAFTGTSCGITISYLLGRVFGNQFIRRHSVRLGLDQQRINKAEIFYNRYGKIALLIGYFIPGVRHLTAVLAGTSLMPYHVFASFAYAGGMFWTITLVSTGYFLGREWHQIHMYSHRYIIPIILLSSILFIVTMYLKATAKKGNAGS